MAPARRLATRALYCAGGAGSRLVAQNMNSATSAHSLSILRPLGEIYVAMFVAQVTGAAAGLWLAHFPGWLDNVWTGAAVMTFPGFLAGWSLLQLRAPDRLQRQRGTVRRLGVSAAMLSAVVVVSAWP